MQQLTPKQLAELGHHFLAFAQAVGNYRYTRKLPASSNKTLGDMQWTLLNYSDDMYAASATVLLTDVRTSLLAIRQVTRDMNETYQNIRNVQKAIDIAAAASTLGAALFSKNLVSVDNALEKLKTQFRGKG